MSGKSCACECRSLRRLHPLTPTRRIMHRPRSSRHSRWQSTALSLSIIALTVPIAHASVGDRSPAYERCVASCTTTECARSPPPRSDSASSSSSSASPWAPYRRSPLWNCPSICSYACQQYLTDLALSLPRTATHPETLEGLPLSRQVQFHGKWPFHRLDLSSSMFPLYLLDWFVPRMQEPLSVVFSLANLWAHHRGFTSLRTLSRTGAGGARTVEGRKLAASYLVYAASGLNAWIWSVVFHTRDLGWTEKADYFGAAATTLTGVWVCIVRMRGWYTSPTSTEAKRVQPILGAALIALFLLHISYLGLSARFDYSYNLKFNILFSLATIALWLFWCFRQSTLPTPSNFSRRQLSAYPSARTRFRAPHHLDPVLPLLLLPSLTLLEVFDFAPIGPFGLRLLDAHALWHLSTVPVVVLWYKFLVRDVRWIDGQGDPPTAANSSSSSSSTTTTSSAMGSLGSRVEGAVKGFEERRGRIGQGVMDFGLGILDRRYGLGFNTNGSKKARASDAGVRSAHSDSSAGGSSSLDTSRSRTE
ncbi:Per1p [Sporobolomyces koalae]|uniref:Per1p n=1 Tax=Sporobolomyces koalae TaxID=500713 RepID=UPI00317E9DC7